ncbi:hypothetical protein [Motilimonas pumila]|uniref:Uncharacterized protein n=1 Tax=Motilimonas pumila TaxID=2303987 RepID=A0A418YDB0_9GAMM|nr:hypothetical protein [Motilimonas pumila]RJG42504.1 hypothetical protein D1Z90_12625 [Motilimonas pumila]
MTTFTTESTISNTFANVLEQSNHAIAEIREKQTTPITATARNIAFACLAVAGSLLLGLFLLQIIQGVLALFIAVGAALALFYGLRFLKAMDPLVKQKTQNFVLQKMIDEARENNTRQLDSLVLQGAERLKHARASRDKMGGYVKKLQSKLAKSNPNTDSNYQVKAEMLQKVENAYQAIRTNVDRAAKSNKAFEKKVACYKDMAEFSDIVGEAMNFAAATSGNKLEELLGLEAFASIEGEFHQAMVSIENSVSDYEIDQQ